MKFPRFAPPVSQPKETGHVSGQPRRRATAEGTELLETKLREEDLCVPRRASDSVPGPCPGALARGVGFRGLPDGDGSEDGDAGETAAASGKSRGRISGRFSSLRGSLATLGSRLSWSSNADTVAAANLMKGEGGGERNDLSAAADEEENKRPSPPELPPAERLPRQFTVSTLSTAASSTRTELTHASLTPSGSNDEGAGRCESPGGLVNDSERCCSPTLPTTARAEDPSPALQERGYPNLFSIPDGVENDGSSQEHDGGDVSLSVTGAAGKVGNASAEDCSSRSIEINGERDAAKILKPFTALEQEGSSKLARTDGKRPAKQGRRRSNLFSIPDEVNFQQLNMESCVSVLSFHGQDEEVSANSGQQSSPSSARSCVLMANQGFSAGSAKFESSQSDEVDSRCGDEEEDTKVSAETKLGFHDGYVENGAERKKFKPTQHDDLPESKNLKQYLAAAVEKLEPQPDPRESVARNFGRSSSLSRLMKPKAGLNRPTLAPRSQQRRCHSMDLLKGHSNEASLTHGRHNELFQARPILDPDGTATSASGVASVATSSEAVSSRGVSSQFESDGQAHEQQARTVPSNATDTSTIGQALRRRPQLGLAPEETLRIVPEGLIGTFPPGSRDEEQQAQERRSRPQETEDSRALRPIGGLYDLHRPYGHIDPHQGPLGRAQGGFSEENTAPRDFDYAGLSQRIESQLHSSWGWSSMTLLTLRSDSPPPESAIDRLHSSEPIFGRLQNASLRQVLPDTQGTFQSEEGAPPNALGVGTSSESALDNFHPSEPVLSSPQSADMHQMFQERSPSNGPNGGRFSADSVLDRLNPSGSILDRLQNLDLRQVRREEQNLVPSGDSTQASPRRHWRSDTTPYADHHSGSVLDRQNIDLRQMRHNQQASRPVDSLYGLHRRHGHIEQNRGPRTRPQGTFAQEYAAPRDFAPAGHSQRIESQLHSSWGWNSVTLPTMRSGSPSSESIVDRLHSSEPIYDHLQNMSMRNVLQDEQGSVWPGIGNPPSLSESVLDRHPPSEPTFGHSQNAVLNQTLRDEEHSSGEGSPSNGPDGDSSPTQSILDGLQSSGYVLDHLQNSDMHQLPQDEQGLVLSGDGDPSNESGDHGDDTAQASRQRHRHSNTIPDADIALESSGSYLDRLQNIDLRQVLPNGQAGIQSGESPGAGLDASSSGLSHPHSSVDGGSVSVPVPYSDSFLTRTQDTDPASMLQPQNEISPAPIHLRSSLNVRATASPTSSGSILDQIQAMGMCRAVQENRDSSSGISGARAEHVGEPEHHNMRSSLLLQQGGEILPMPLMRTQHQGGLLRQQGTSTPSLVLRHENVRPTPGSYGFVQNVPIERAQSSIPSLQREGAIAASSRTAARRSTAPNRSTSAAASSSASLGRTASRRSTAPFSTKSNAGASNSSGPTALYNAVSSCASYDTVQSIIDANPSVTGHQNGGGMTALHCAIERYDTPISVIRMLLLANPATAGYRSRMGYRPLDLVWKRFFEPELYRSEEMRQSAAQLRQMMEAVVADDNCALGYVVPENDSDQKICHRERARKANAIRALYSSVELRELWDLTVLFVKAAHHGTTAEELPPWMGRWRVVHAAAATDCAQLLIRFASALHPDQIRQSNEQSGRLLLHTCAAADLEGDGFNTDESTLQSILAMHPGAASCHDGDGRLPLNLAIESRKSWKSIKMLLLACPRALSMRDTKTHVLPFMLSAEGDNADLDIVYRLLRENPLEVSRGIP